MSDKEPLQQCSKNNWRGRDSSPSGAVYGLGVVGAAFFYIQHASSFWIGVLGVLKALVWPALLVYKLVGLLKF